MLSQTDPIRRLTRLRLVVDCVIGVVMLGFIGLMITRPETAMLDAAAAAQPPQQASVLGESGDAEFPTAAFSKVLWYVPPADTPIEQVAAVPMPRIKLLGIGQTDSGFEAVLLDEELNEVHTVGPGDQFGAVTILEVSATSVEASAHDRAFVIRLDGD